MESIINYTMTAQNLRNITCCNPCCNGINHKQAKRRVFQVQAIVVILVVMESIINSLRITHSVTTSCCNPCCNGINHKPLKSVPLMKFLGSCNPCCNGINHKLKLYHLVVADTKKL